MFWFRWGRKAITCHSYRLRSRRPNRREKPDVLQKLILLYPTFAKNASPFLMIFLKKVVSRSLSTIKSSIFFPIFRLTSCSTPAHEPFSHAENARKHTGNAAQTVFRTVFKQARTSSNKFKGPQTSSFPLVGAQNMLNGTRHAHQGSFELNQAQTSSIPFSRAHSSSTKLNLCSIKLNTKPRSSELNSCSIKLNTSRAHQSSNQARLTYPSDGSCRA